MTWKRVWLEPCPGVGERAVMRPRWYGWEIITRTWGRVDRWGTLGYPPHHCSRDA